jgi:hypothetical protein
LVKFSLERLHPDLMAVAQKGRTDIIPFDYGIQAKDEMAGLFFLMQPTPGQCIE